MKAQGQQPFSHHLPPSRLPCASLVVARATQRRWARATQRRCLVLLQGQTRRPRSQPAQAALDSIITKQIAEADERNDRKIDECNRNMEIQATQLTDSLATVKDMMERMAASFLDDKNARSSQLIAIDNRFNLQHKTQQEQHQQQQQQTGDIMKLLGKMQSSVDALACRMPDEPPTKARKADGADGEAAGSD